MFVQLGDNMSENFSRCSSLVMLMCNKNCVNKSHSKPAVFSKDFFEILCFLVGQLLLMKKHFATWMEKSCNLGDVHWFSFLKLYVTVGFCNNHGKGPWSCAALRSWRPQFFSVQKGWSLSSLLREEHKNFGVKHWYQENQHNETMPVPCSLLAALMYLPNAISDDPSGLISDSCEW